MDLLGLLTTALLVLLNLWAIAALVLGYRRAARGTVRRLARLAARRALASAPRRLAGSV